LRFEESQSLVDLGDQVARLNLIIVHD
jgi:hypothetical protein